MFTNWGYVTLTLYWELYPVSGECSVSFSHLLYVLKVIHRRAYFPDLIYFTVHSVGGIPCSHKHWSSNAIYKSTAFHSPMAQYCNFYIYFFCQPVWKLSHVIEVVGGKYESDFPPLLEKQTLLKHSHLIMLMVGKTAKGDLWHRLVQDNRYEHSLVILF